MYLEVQVTDDRVVVDAFLRYESSDVVVFPGDSEVLAGAEKPLDQAGERGFAQARPSLNAT